VPDAHQADKGILDDLDRSDRESGRPVQLEKGESRMTAPGYPAGPGGDVGEAIRR
jgi:hypothetical protein